MLVLRSTSQLYKIGYQCRIRQEFSSLLTEYKEMDAHNMQPDASIVFGFLGAANWGAILTDKAEI